MDFRLVKNELNQNTAQTKHLLAQRRSNPILAHCRKIPFVEDQIDHLKDGGEADNAPGAAWDLKSDVRLGEGPLRADDPLSNNRNKNKKAPRDLLGRQTAENTKYKHDPY